MGADEFVDLLHEPVPASADAKLRETVYGSPTINRNARSGGTEPMPTASVVRIFGQHGFSGFGFFATSTLIDLLGPIGHSYLSES